MPEITPEVRLAIDLWHSGYHGGGVDECSIDHTSPCFLVALLRENDRLRERVAKRADAGVKLQMLAEFRADLCDCGDGDHCVDWSYRAALTEILGDGR